MVSSLSHKAPSLSRAKCERPTPPRVAVRSTISSESTRCVNCRGSLRRCRACEEPFCRLCAAEYGYKLRGRCADCCEVQP